MPPLYKLFTGISALTGSLSLIITGELNPVFVALGSFMFIGYYRAVKGYSQASRFIIGTFTTIVIFIFFTDTLIITRDLLIGVAHLTLLFHGLKSFDIKDPWDPLQVFFMSLIQILLASEYTRSLIFGAVFIVFLVVMVFSITYSHLVKEGNMNVRQFIYPISSITILVLVLTVLFFISIPRIEGGFWGKGERKLIKSGFSETVRLGDFGEMKSDPTVVMRVTLEPEKGYIPYWRGIAFEIYRNDTWHDIKKNKWRHRYSGNDGEFKFRDQKENKTIKQEILFSPLDTNVIFAIRDAVKLNLETGYIIKDETGTLFLPETISKKTKYTAFSTNDMLPVTEPQSLFLNYLNIPKGNEKLKKLTENTIEGIVTDTGRAKKIEHFLRDNYKYSLKTTPPPDGISPIEDFLFRTKKGYCEHYATAMVLMLRSVGIPARVLSGYMGGDYNNYGHYLIVRQSHAHTWVEAAIDGKWMTFDPTPSTQEEEQPLLMLYLDFIRMKWDRYVVGFSKFDQLRILRSISIPFRKPDIKGIDISFTPVAYLLLFVVLVLSTAYLLKTVKSKSRSLQVSRYYIDIKKKLSKKIIVKRSQSAGDILDSLKGCDMNKKKLLRDFFRLYGVLRFGNIGDKNLWSEYLNIYKELKKEL